MVIGTSCSKCGKNKETGQVSCCFRGGSWFNKCGDMGDHTWSEGVDACKQQANLDLGEVQLQQILTKKVTVKQQSIDFVDARAHGLAAANSQGHSELTRLAAFIGVCFFSLHIGM